MELIESSLFSEKFVTASNPPTSSNFPFMMKSSKLLVNAPEFVPSKECRLKLNLQAKEFIPLQKTINSPNISVFDLQSTALEFKNMYKREEMQYMQSIHVSAVVMKQILQQGKNSVPGNLSTDAQRKFISALETEERKKSSFQVVSAKNKVLQKKKPEVFSNAEFDSFVVEKTEIIPKKAYKKKESESPSMEEKLKEIVLLDEARHQRKQLMQTTSQLSAQNLLLKRQRFQLLRMQGWSDISGIFLGNMISSALVENSKLLLEELSRIQERNYKINPNTKKHFVSGLKQILKLTRANQIKYIIVARKIDELVDYFPNLLAEAVIRHVPIIFSLNRRQLSNAVGKQGGKVSAVGVLDSSAGHDFYTKMLTEANLAREKYQLYRNDPFRQLAIS